MSSLKYKFGFILGLLLVSGNFVSSQLQEEPINCYTCEGNDCAASVGLLRVCEGEQPQQCVIVFDSDSTVVSRGCSGKIAKTQADYCGSNNEKCISCSSNGCNVATALSDYIQCLSCDSTTDRNCALNPDLITSTKLCYKSCMTSLYVKNLTDATPKYELLRSCLDDKNLDDKVICSNGEDELCQACDEEKCNVARIPKESFRCYSCPGEDCTVPVSKECVSQVENDQCYFLFDENKDVVQMGCRSEFNEDEVVAKTKEQKLLLCDGSECNYFNNFPQPRDCYKCDSATDENCAIEPMSVESSITCGIPYTQCYTKVSVSGINAGVTVRGCLSDLQGDEFYDCLLNADKKCQSCSGSDCNQKIVPEDRIQCQRCNSESDSSCHKNPSELGMCPVYSQNETCVSAYTNGVTQRGCGTEFTCDSSNPKSCQICSSAGCNVDNVKKATEEIYGIFQDLPIKCYTCEGDECQGNGGELKTCEGSIYQDCITVFNEGGKVIRRGCEVLVEAEFSEKCDANPELCFNCKANGCNTIISPTEFVECSYCDSANDPDCVLDVSAISKQRKCAKGCVTALYPRSDDASIFELARTCLDDLEIDDIDSCGGDFKCDKCSESKCNNIAMPDVRLSCNSCNTSNCDKIVSKECTAYSETDQCFMLFDDTLSVSRMGCKSELSAREIQTSIKQLFLCDGVNCNSYESLPEANICSVCNSTSDVLCATSPADVRTAARCQTYPYTQCYSKVSSDGSTARGCLLSLEVEEFLECLGEDSSKCQICVDNKCNTEIFPANRQSCQRCNSLDDTNCETLPSATGTCALYSENDICVTKIVDGITYRDCGSEISCGTLGRRNCRTCTESDCNTVDLIGESPGDPGLWQGLPINCYICDGEECATSNGILQMCVGDKNQLCTTVFDQQGKVTARGCSNSIDARYGSYCNDNPSDCFECKSNACNLATDKADYVDCIYCDAQSNVNCTGNVAELSRTRKCHKACMTALYPRTSDVDASYELSRSCLDDKDLDDRENCDNDPLCHSCSGKACNTQLIPEVRKTCNHCKGESCQTSVISPCRSYTKHEQCFILFDEVGSVYEMGCKSDYDPSEVKSLIIAKRLYLCDDDNCNGFESIPMTSACWLCNSRTDRFCATNPQNVASSTSCTKLPFTECYTRVLEDGHTERGCLSSLEGDQFLECYNNSSDLCSVCAEGRCNGEIFPIDRLSCHICNSAEDSGCEVTPKYSSVCRTHSSEQTCITTLNDGIVQRGCSEQLTCDLSDRTSCRACNTTDCNVVNLKRFSDANPGLWQDLPINCYTCAGDECVDKNERLNICTGNAYQHCMTVFDETNVVVRRGCSDAVEEDFANYCDENSEKCFNCNSNGCNSATRLTDYVDCVYCDSRSNKNCVLDVSAVSATRKCHKSCMVALFPKSQNETSSYELSRSCLDDKDLDDREQCNSDGSYCKSCNSITCNVEDVVEERLECFSCLGDSCVSPVSGKCTIYAEKPTCFMLFDADSTAQRMGCTSELNIKEIEENVDKLFTCSGNNCNDFSNILQPQTCAECDSSSNVVCATNPISIGTVRTCSSLPHTNCYTRVKSDGTTARGCVSSLSKSLLLECLDSNSTSCTSCIGNRCNAEIYPEDRLRCHKCNSIDDPTCQDAPDAAVVCPLYFESEVCSSKLVNDVTYRACGDSFKCDDSDKQYCKMCNSTNCNQANLYQNNIGYPGLWQGVPINCLTCFGDECDSSSTTLLRKCENNNRQNCITVFNMMGKVVERGCSDNIYNGFYDHHCDKHPDLCTYCKSSGCNDADSLDDFIDCVFCDSATNANCTLTPTDVSRTRKCQKKCMTALYPQSNESGSAYNLARTCLDDKDLDDQEICDTDGALCKSCDTGLCNVLDAVDDRLQCIFCIDDSCGHIESRNCAAYKLNDTCFMLFDNYNSVQRMGCTSDLDAEELESNLDNLFVCSGNNCNHYSNIPQPQTCTSCDSKTDVRCATSPNGVGSVSQCTSLPNVDCYTRVKADGTTTRGCVSELTKALRQSCLSGNDTTCSTCKGNGCNLDIFPEDRLRCHKCNSIDDPTCQDAPDAAVVCPLHLESEVCSSKLVNDVTYRACGDSFKCDDSDKQYCKMCNSTNCNQANLYQNNIGYPGLWQGVPINCLTCFGDECDSSSTTLLRKCENNNRQNCITVFNMMGKVVERGCSDNIYNGFYDHHCDKHPDLCTYCKSSGCNDADSLDAYVDCLFCDSTTNPSCTSDVTGVSRTRKCQKCMTAIYPRSDEEDPAYELSRSCLDDKDYDDRNKCANNNDELCVSCEDDKCNNVRLPDVDRLSCLQCSGDGCTVPIEAECSAFRENDRCFILFDDTNTIQRMGCGSDLDSSVIVALRKKLLFCDGDNCNTFDKIPSPRTCLACDSANDTLCATKPNSLLDFKFCSSFPYTSCYMRIEGGLTKRGCLADIEFDTIDECIQNGDDIKCNVCNTEYCNVGVYPVGRRSCHRCSSEDDSNCQSIPNNYGVCPIYEESDNCVVEVSSHRTTRGCTSDFTCNIEDRENCRICTTDNCNTVDLQSSYVGKPGQWQDLPLTCYECEGSTCESPVGDQKTCENNNLQNCMTVFDLTGAVVKRGCSDDVIETHEEYCDENGGRCQTCRSSRCNTATSLNDYVDCIFCDSSTNPNCVLNPSVGTSVRKCHKQCMVALFPRSSEENPAYELTRTCLDDKELEDRDSCALGTEEHCQACSAPGCNNFALPTDRHQCWTCQGDDCDDAQIQNCVSHHPEDQCYILFNNLSSIISMGCRSQLPEQSVISLIQTKSLLLCDGKNCNSYDTIPDPQACVACNSATDPRCATNPNLIPNVVTCSALPYTGCVTRINENGDTVRGCQTALSNSEFYGCHTSTDAACSTCPGNKCNADVFPADRLKCHRCNSKDDDKCAESPASNGVCPKITEGESCVVAYIDGVTHRGCSSQLSCNAADKTTCRICTGSACNTHNLEAIMKDGQPGKWQELPLNCFICEGESCKDSYGPLNMCSNSTIQNCMTVFNTDGSVIQRGCSNDVLQTQDEWCERNSDKCYRCNSNGCNMAYSLDDYIECLSCDTSSDGACVKSPSSLVKTRKCYKSCMTALYPHTSEENPAYHTSRSCLDDKDLDDRDSCKDGSEDLCSTCDNDKCNVDDLPSDRQSCYHCSGNECQSPKQELCVGYRANDQCYIKFDERQMIIGMGCRSELTIAHSIELIKIKQLLLCDEDNCNYFDGVPASQSCALCNSKTDVNCATNPSGVSSSTSCSRLPYTQCYSRVLDNGATERGCLSSLINNEFYDCLIGNSTTCASCIGSNCNKEIYPADRISCHVCDSSSDPNCESSPDSLGICVKYQEKETCATSFNGIDTIRNCGASLKCDTSSPRKCRICDSTGCNVADLASIFDDNFGKWQDLPLSCFDCEGDDCKEELSDAVKCQINNEQDCSTVFNAAGQVIRRGCSDKVEIEYVDHCDANPELCFGCKSNKCNNATALTEFIDCVYCDSRKDINCVSSPLLSTFKTRQCQGSCMVALYPSDSSLNPAYELIRTCLNDKESANQTSCNGGEDNSCDACTEDNCNVRDFPEGRLRCHTCLGDSCVQSESELCPLYKKDDQCFIRFDSTNSIIEMGCLSKFGGQDLVDILKTKRVYICEGDDCNYEIPEPNQCSVCDSAVDIKCATNPHQVGNVSTCRTFPYTDCYTKITAAGTTQKGCLIDLPDVEFAQCIISGGDQCTHCVGNGCNKAIFPENRLQCYSCTSDIDPECEFLPTTTVVCPYVRDSERCVTSLSGNITERACSTDLHCDAADKNTCRRCSSIGCNTLDLANRYNDGNHGKWQDLPLRCHTCNGEHCQHSLGPALACEYGDEQDCLTVFNETGVVIHRGCEYDVEDEYNTYCRLNPDKCLACKSNECNDAWTLDNYIDCVYCNSELDPTCATNPNKPGFPIRKCQKGCMAATFTALNGTTQIIRTCLDDKELPSRYECSLDESEKQCASCSGRKCNSFKYPKDRLTCHVCQGTNCTETVEQYCAAYNEDDKCFAKYRNFRVEIFGCVSDIDSSVLTEWKEDNEVYICSGDSCNAPDNLPSNKKCVLCDSRDNVECATNPSAISNYEMCFAPITSCYSRIVNGLTHRACLSSLALQQQEICEADASGLCEVCKEDSCNKEVFPSDRRRCHICNTENDDKCKAKPDSVSICPVYALNNLCVVKLTDGLTERGCSTDLTCDADDEKHCSICNKDGCNIAQLDNGSYTIVTNNLLLTFLVAFVGLMGVISNY